MSEWMRLESWKQRPVGEDWVACTWFPAITERRASYCCCCCCSSLYDSVHCTTTKKTTTSGCVFLFFFSSVCWLWGFRTWIKHSADYAVYNSLSLSPCPPSLSSSSSSFFLRGITSHTHGSNINVSLHQSNPNGCLAFAFADFGRNCSPVIAH